MNKKYFLLLGFFLLLSSNSYSKTNLYQVTGTVSSVEVLKTYSEQRVPKNQKNMFNSESSSKSKCTEIWCR